MKAYSAKSSAVRAAKNAFGAEWESKAAVLPATPEQGQGWVIIERQPAPKQEVATLAKPTAQDHPMRRLEDLTPVKTQDAQAPWLRLPNLLDAGGAKAEMIHKLEEVIEELKELPVEPATEAAQEQADAQANRLALGWKLSTTAKPTKKVWVIASDMPGKSRKEVIEACIAAGIGAGTARTQYQAWFSAMKASGQTPGQKEQA